MPYYQDCYIAASENVNNLSDRCYHDCFKCFLYVYSMASATAAAAPFFSVVAMKNRYCAIPFPDPGHDALLLFVFFFVYAVSCIESLFSHCNRKKNMSM